MSHPHNVRMEPVSAILCGCSVGTFRWVIPSQVSPDAVNAHLDGLDDARRAESNEAGYADVTSSVLVHHGLPGEPESSSAKDAEGSDDEEEVFHRLSLGLVGAAVNGGE